MEILLDERFNEQSGLLEKVTAYIGQKGDGFSQIAEITVEKAYFLNGECVHGEILYDYTKPENDVRLK